MLLFQEVSDFGPIEVGVDLMSPQRRDPAFGGPERQPANPVAAPSLRDGQSHGHPIGQRALRRNVDKLSACVSRVAMA